MTLNMTRVVSACIVAWLAACKGTEPVMPVPTAVAVSPGSVSLAALGATRQLAAFVLDQRGDTIGPASVTWSTTDPAVATIDNSGLLTAVAVGQTQVSASMATSSGSLVGSADVAVTQVPARLEKVSGDGQTDTVSQTLPRPVVVQLSDALGHPIPDIVVTFVVTGGGGSPSATGAATDAAGRAAVQWTIGSTSGTNTLSASVAGVSATTFTAFGIVPGSSPAVTAFAGTAQRGLAGDPVNVPPAVRLLDGSGVPMAGVAVSFSVTEGGGSLLGGAAVTDANGVAAVASWTLTLGTNTLTATVQSSGPMLGNPVVFTASGETAAYHVEVRLLTPMSASRQQAFTGAAAKWETLIFGDVPDQPIFRTSSWCGGLAPPMNETVDDIVIFARIDSIDGPGKILGRAGPCLLRSGSRLPAVGEMEFDSADVGSLEQDGQFALVIEHEMGHVLGYGTIWTTLGLLAGASTSDPHFVGPQALAAFDQIGGSGYTAGAKVPVENCCGTGTRNTHWRESVLGNELMTGFLDNGANPLSVLTTASMGDLGYAVSYARSDPFLLTLALIAAPVSGRWLADDILRVPIEVVDEAGRVVRVIAP